MMRQRGMILIAVLVFLEILSVLGLSVLQGNLWENKLTQRFWTKSRMLSVAKTELFAVENKLLQYVPDCQIPEMPALILADKDFTWWRSLSCAGNFRMFQYYYLVEFLGADPCTFLKDAGRDSEWIAGYYRISLLVVPAHNFGQKLIIQSSITRPVIRTTMCAGRRHGVASGRQMFRELI